jgi:hypothetical protein
MSSPAEASHLPSPFETASALEKTSGVSMSACSPPLSNARHSLDARVVLLKRERVRVARGGTDVECGSEEGPTGALE